MIGGLSPWHLLLIAVVALLVFGGGGKLSGLMGDAAKGIKAFRDGMKDDHDAPKTPVEPTPLPRTETAVPRDDVKN